MDRAEIAAKVFPGKLTSLINLWERLDDVLTECHLTRDVKTIYVSYTDDDHNLVAAIHPDPTANEIEMALSLPPDTKSDLTYDAIHLKWRTLPLAIRLTPDDKMTDGLLDLIQVAIDNAPTAVQRPPEDFGRINRRGRYQA